MRAILKGTCDLPVLAKLAFAASFCVGLVLSGQSAAWSADPQRPTRSKIDDDLLKDLDNELLEGAGNLKSRQPAKSADTKSADPSDVKPGQEGEDIGEPSARDPLSRISRDMRSAEKLIPDDASRSRTQRVQQQILDDLARLIAEAEKQASQQKSSSKNSRKQETAQRKSVSQPKQSAAPGKESNKPARDSTERIGEADPMRPDPETLKGLMKDSWGHLPPHAREQMLQNTPERFLPQYELLIERYYKRLAEEQVK